MYIHEIRIAKFRHLENVVIGPLKFNSKSSETFVLAGPNGGGKSSILELIGYALSNSYSLGWSLNRTFAEFSFEVAIGLTPTEIKEITNDLEIEFTNLCIRQDELNSLPETDNFTKLEQHQFTLNNKPRMDFLKQLLDYFKHNNAYYRSFKYESGEYEKNKNFYNQIHGLVTSILTAKLNRPLGFLLKADRAYPPKGFERNKIFNFSSTLRYEHLKSLAFNTSEIQYQDMYDFLVQQRYHYLRKLGSHQYNLDNGIKTTGKPEDPLKQYEVLLQKLFPDYSFVEKEEDVPSNLFIKLPTEEIITFNDLSSGEKEVFFLLSFFIRHNVENAIIMIDEPELHLHPELARLLIRNMQHIKKGNQIWLATHNSEIIDEAGRDRVMYVSKDPKTKKAKIINGKDENESINELKNLFGFSGYIGISKNLVFLEGDNASADRKFFANLIPTSSNVKFIPSSGSNNMHRLNAAILSILESNFGWMNFFLIRDKDYLTVDMISKYRQHKSNKIFVLEKHEIENYLLIPSIIATTLEEIHDISVTEVEIKELLLSCALEISASVLRDMISFRTNLLLEPQNFSMGKFLNDKAIIDSNFEFNPDIRSLLVDKFSKTANEVCGHINSFLSIDNVTKIISECEAEMQSAFNNGTWLDLFPGKELLETLCKKLKISSQIAFQNSLIKELSVKHELIPSDLKRIISVIS